MALCKFTSTEAGKPPIYVNPAAVFLVRRVGANTYIITESGTKVTVAEPLDEVVARLDAHLPANRN